MATEPAPIACTLTTKEAASQIGEWGALRRQATEVVSIDGGYRMTMPVTTEATVRDLAAREASCCASLSLDVACNDDAVTLTITGPADAKPVIDLIVATRR